MSQSAHVNIDIRVWIIIIPTRHDEPIKSILRPGFHTNETSITQQVRICHWCIGCWTIESSPEFDEVRSCEHPLHGPFGQFASVVLQFIGEDGAALHVQLLTPVDVSGMLKELIKYHDNPKKRQKCSFYPPDARVGLITSRAASKYYANHFGARKNCVH